VSVVEPSGRSPQAGRRADRGTYSGRGLHGRLVDSLGSRVVIGELAPGEIIDLDQLAADEDVSRTVVREAVKVLVGKGLLDARPKYGTFVRERSSWNLLDPEIMRWRSAGGPDQRLLRELEEVRSMLEPVTARLAAMRRDDAHVAALEEAFQMMRLSNEAADHVDADLRFHRLMASATGNELLETLATMLEPAQRARDVLAFQHFAHDASFLRAHEAVLDAIRARAPEAAEAAMRTLLEEAGRDIESVIDRDPRPDEGAR
jgi:GntR family transcriptional regulator, galactonate operon transcriptional repressor